MPSTKIVLRQPETQLEAARIQTEAQRQMRESGSISPLRGYQPEFPDIYVEKVGRNTYLGTPATRTGVDWIRARMRNRHENVFFVNGLILNHDDVHWLLTHRTLIRIRMENYFEDEEVQSEESPVMPQSAAQ